LVGWIINLKRQRIYLPLTLLTLVREKRKKSEEKRLEKTNTTIINLWLLFVVQEDAHE
jgi:hypothetical protein